MNRFSGKARGKGNIESSRGRFRHKKVVLLSSVIRPIPEDSTKNEVPAVDEISYTDESDKFSSDTNDSQTLSESSSYGTAPSKDIAQSTPWIFGGGFEGTLDKLGDSAIFGMNDVVPFLDDSKYWKSNANYWKSKALKFNREGEVVKPGDLSVDDSEDESDDDSVESSEEGSEEDDESDNDTTVYYQEDSKEHSGLEILLANDDESLSSCQEKSGFRVKSKEFIEANEAEKRAFKGEKGDFKEKEAPAKIQRKWDRSIIVPIKDFIEANIAEQRAAQEEDAGTKQQRESDRNLVAPINTPQSMAYPAPIFHSRSKFQDKDEDLNGPAMVKMVNSRSSETSLKTVVGKPNVVDKSGTEIEVSRITSTIAEAGVASASKNAELNIFHNDMFSSKEAGMEVSRVSSRFIAIGDDSCLIKAESFGGDSAGNPGPLKGTASYPEESGMEVSRNASPVAIEDENIHHVPCHQMKVVQYYVKSGMELSRIPSSTNEEYNGYTQNCRNRMRSPISSSDENGMEVPRVASSVSDSQCALSVVESETSGGRPRRVMSPMQNLEEDGVEVERVVSPVAYLGYTLDEDETDGHIIDEPLSAMGTIHDIEERGSEVSEVASSLGAAPRYVRIVIKSRMGSTETGCDDADMQISSLPSPLKIGPRNVFRRTQKELAVGGVEKPHSVVSAAQYLDEADMDMSSLPSPSRKSSRVEHTNGSTTTSQSVRKELHGKHMPMNLSGGGHIPFDEFEDGQSDSMDLKSSKKILKEGKDSIELQKFKTEQEKQAFTKSLQNMHDRNKTAPHRISEVAPIDNVQPRESKAEQEKVYMRHARTNEKRRSKITHRATQSPTRSSFHQGAQNSPSAGNSTFAVLSPSAPEQFNGEKYTKHMEKLPAATFAGILQDSSRFKTVAKKQAAPINVTIQSKQDSDNILQDLRYLTRTVSQTGISKAVPTHGPYGLAVPPPPPPPTLERNGARSYGTAVPPPPPLPPAPERNGARPRAGFSKWEDEVFDFRQVKGNAFAQASVIPAIKPWTPKTKAFISTKQIQAASAPVRKPTAPTANVPSSKMRPQVSSVPASKPLIAKTDTFPSTKTSTAPASKQITPKTNALIPQQHPHAAVASAVGIVPAFAPKQHPHVSVAPVSKQMALEANRFAAKKQRQIRLACPPKEKQLPPSQSRKDTLPPSLQGSRQTFTSKIQPQVSSTPVAKPFPRKASAPKQHPQGSVAPVSQSFAPNEKPLPPCMTRSRSTIAPQPQLQARRQPPRVAQPVVEPSLAPTVDTGGWEDFENRFANDFKKAFANAHPKVRITT